MIDIHSHILPGIDDGSQDSARSIEQLQMMGMGGIDRVYLTSHYFRGHYQYTRTEYDAKLEDLRSLAEAGGLAIDIKPGFEVFIQPQIIDDIKQHSLFLGNSPYILIESELNGLPQDFYNNVYPILRSGIKPILAHAERYVSIMHRASVAEDLIDKDMYIQVNAGSLLGLYGDKVRETAYRLLHHGWVHFIASDDHVRGDYQVFFDAYEKLCEHFDEYTANLLMKDFPSRIESGEKIPYKYVEIRHSRPRRKRSLLSKLLGV